ncbi:polymeric immunoglobulin receptor-like isoform X5 [Xiphophorus maculatus]|uniref:polymeric immunoglobulin receptor-like isoform X5 n=1 Tax=Xiphophorus maculatus TaxID=8083 RepID=UPI000C6DAC9F|nr:polymeric immunoglobulin receptor-like isoform X5 [Xiphophorus maculatus]
MIIAWFCLVCLSLHITNSRTADPVTRFYGVPGGEINIECSFPSSGEWKIFCRKNCKKKNILIETRKTSDENGRYRIESDGNNQYDFVVSISALTQSDSGWYRCGLRTFSSRYSYQDFELVVAEAVLDGNDVPDLFKEAGSSVTVACSFKDSGRKRRFCRGKCEKVLVETDGVRAKRGRYSIETSGEVLYVSISALTQSDSGWYRCYLDMAFGRDPYRDFYLKVTDDVLMIVGLALAFIIIILTVALLVFCRNRSQKHGKDPAVKTKKTPAVETNRVYEEVRGDEMKSVPVEISTVYSYASYSKPAAADGVYSLATAALPLDKAEDDLTRPTYAQVSFSSRSSDYPLRPSDDVVYSVPRVAVGSHVAEESLYSNTA